MVTDFLTKRLRNKTSYLNRWNTWSGMTSALWMSDNRATFVPTSGTVRPYVPILLYGAEILEHEKWYDFNDILEKLQVRLPFVPIVRVRVRVRIETGAKAEVEGDKRKSFQTTLEICRILLSVLKVNNSTPKWMNNWMIYGELGRYPLLTVYRSYVYEAMLN